jgi:CheY-like chemotaxis protein
VLVVEDHPDVAQSLGMLLELLGYQVAIAQSAEAALEICAERCPRVALVDIGLPDMDGLELARRLRQRYPDRARLSLVALTGYGHDEAKVRALEAGFDQHLAKPVDRRTLETVLDQAL